jgi:cytidylate kinase
MIVALFGASACGKTALAELAAAELGIAVRHCGREIANAAVAAGHDLAAIPDHLYRALDQQTRDWCTGIKGVVLIEGRFVDRVLEGRPDAVFVHVKAGLGERSHRLTKRLERPVDEEEVRSIDAEDDLLRLQLYQSSRQISAAHEIVTEGASVLECGHRLVSLIRALTAAVPG